MFKILFLLVLVLSFLFPISSFTEGDGSILNPYNVTNCVDLQNMSFNLAANYSLKNNIDCSITQTWNNNGTHIFGFKPIGNFSFKFTGNFDGNNFEISNLYINRLFENEVGLFGESDNNISNVNLINFNISGYDSVGSLVGSNGGFISNSSSHNVWVYGYNYYAGGLVGYNAGGGAIDNSYSSGSIWWGYYSVGGLVGYSGGDVINSSSDVDVEGDNHVGGLVGFNDGSISNSFSNGDVNGYSRIGGLAGASNGAIDNSYTTGDVVGDDRVGGLAGYHWFATISDSYATGNVLGNDSVGGLIGRSDSTADIFNSFSQGDVVGVNDVGGSIGFLTAGGTLSNVWWLNTSTNLNNSVGNGTSINVYSASSASWFYNCDNEPMNSWTSNWVCSGNGLPSLFWQNLDASNQDNFASIFPSFSLVSLFLIIIGLFLFT